MKRFACNRKPNQAALRVATALASLTALVAASDVSLAAKVRPDQSVAVRPGSEPIMAIVSLHDQQITVYDDKGMIMRAPVSSGQKGRETPAGIFSVLSKNAEHYSNLYDDAFMPHMQRLTWSGIALHGGPLPGYPASHGCIRLPYSFAERLFGTTKIGMRVIVAPGGTGPVAIEHPALFQPKTDHAAAAAAAAATKVEEATAKADQTRLAAVTANRESTLAIATVRKTEALKLRAEAELAAAERAIASASSPEAKERIESAKEKVASRVGELEPLLAAAKSDLQPKVDAVTAAREAAAAADRERVAATESALARSWRHFRNWAWLSGIRASANWIWLWVLRATIGFGIGLRYFRTVPWALAFVLMGALVLAGSEPMSLAPSQSWLWRLGASLDQLLPIVKLSPKYAAFFDERSADTLNFWQNAYFTLHRFAGWLLGISFLQGSPA